MHKASSCSPNICLEMGKIGFRFAVPAASELLQTDLVYGSRFSLEVFLKIDVKSWR